MSSLTRPAIASNLDPRRSADPVGVFATWIGHAARLDTAGSQTARIARASALWRARQYKAAIRLAYAVFHAVS